MQLQKTKSCDMVWSGVSQQVGPYVRTYDLMSAYPF